MRPEKQLLLNAVKDHMQSAPDFVLTSYQKMDANLTFEFRRAIRDSGGFLYVFKKRVFLKAVFEVGLQLDRFVMSGHLGIVHLAADIVKTAKIVHDYGRDHSNMIEILGGRVEGKDCSSQEIEQISKLPSRDEMRSQLLGTLASLLSETVEVMRAVLAGPIHCVDGKIRKEKPL